MAKSKKREKALKGAAQQEKGNAQEGFEDVSVFRPLRDQVLSIPELFELVFLDLDMAHLLTAVQQVCKHWNRDIAHSAVLQQHLFFKAIPSTPSPSDPPLAEPIRALNPLLYKHFSILFPWNPEFDLKVQDKIDRETIKEPPPLLREGIVSPRFKVLPMSWDTIKKMKMLPMADIGNGGSLHHAFTPKGASWRRMLVSQPPPVRVGRIGDLEDMDVNEDEYEDSISDWHYPRHDIRELDSNIPGHILERAPKCMVAIEGGLRMGDLMDELWTVEYGREYPFRDAIAWCTWQVPSLVKRETWSREYRWEDAERYRTPTTQLSKWTDGAELVIGGFVPHEYSWNSRELLCWECKGESEEKPRNKRCKEHLARQQRHHCQEYKAKRLLTLIPSI